MSRPTLLGETGRTSAPEQRDDLLGAVLAEISGRPRGGPPWLAERRASATAWLRTRGLPAPNDEAFRFTPLRPVLRVPYRVAGTPPGELPRAGFPWTGTTLTLVNGRPSSAPQGEPGLELLRLSEVLAKTPDRIAPFFALAEGPGDGFEAMNDALFDEGVLVVAHPGGPRRLHLFHASLPAQSPVLAVPRVLVLAEPGSDLTLVETHASRPGAVLECGVCRIAVRQGARVEHVRFSKSEPEHASVWSLSVHQDRDSHYTSRTFTFGGALARETVEVTLDGEGAECVLEGLYTAHTGDLVDHHTTIVHARPRGTSRERYKGVVDGSGTAVFDGTIVVEKDAARTEAHQENRNLLVSNDAVVHSKPHLEIDTDDVRVSHGSTIGRLDPAQLFYLRSRGIDESIARATLMVAFARELLLEVKDAEVRRYLDTELSRKLPGGSAVLEGA